MRTRIEAQGFTMIELLVVLAVVGMLVAIVVPRYTAQVDRATEVALRQNLATMRDALQQFRADRGAGPSDLQTLVATGYLRAIPTDPVSGRSDTWVVIVQASEVQDVRSGAPGQGRDGVAYAAW